MKQVNNIFLRNQKNILIEEFKKICHIVANITNRNNLYNI